MQAWLLKVTWNKEKSFNHHRNYWFIYTADIIYLRLYLLASDYPETVMLLKEMGLDMQGRSRDIHSKSCKPSQRAALGFNWLGGGVLGSPAHSPFNHRGHWNCKDYNGMPPGCPFHYKWNWKWDPPQHKWALEIHDFLNLLSWVLDNCLCSQTVSMFSYVFFSTYIRYTHKSPIYHWQTFISWFTYV